MVASALRNPVTDPNMAEAFTGCTALTYAARYGNPAVVTLLLADQRVDPNKANHNGYTALMTAAESGNAAVIKLLLGDERVNPNVLNTMLSATALTFAAYSGDTAVMELLLADHRTIRTRPAGDESYDGARAAYDAALLIVKKTHATPV